MSVTPAFQGEVQFRRYSDTSTQGSQIVLGLADREDLQSFVGLEGKRFMAVFVQIGDDEQPVPPAKEKRMGPYCYQAVKWCADRDFQKWVARCSQLPLDSVGAQEAKQFILKMCGIKSRKALDDSEEAQRMWHANIVGPYRKSRIARGLE